ncbi:hypothetical protein EVJ58_g9943 [Rhodofomes roseus]|uniref:Uncharacterized protein n=1 Tax=Rhodofomes roseus TaxID=34475 RepID=A0A4Y9XVL0_9APHY|nr:hypothetical protein EVJ58_g9943 [Rhodofomes roseus]
MQTRLFLVLLALFCALLVDVASATPRARRQRAPRRKALPQAVRDEAPRRLDPVPSREAQRALAGVEAACHARTHPSVNALSSRFGLPDDRLINEFLLASCVRLASADVQ